MIEILLSKTLRFFLKGIQDKKLSILIYHRVLDKKDPLSPDEFDKIMFTEHLEILKKFYNVLSLSDALEKLAHNSLPPNSVVITFDDGYADNYYNALPILNKYNMSATFFIATGYLRGRIMWNDVIANAIRKTDNEYLDLSSLKLGKYSLGNRKQVFEDIIKMVKYEPYQHRENISMKISDICHTNIPAGLMMNESQVAKLSNSGMEIGGHTVNHPILLELEDDQALKEITQCKKDLEAITKNKITLFAYPNGKPNTDYGKKHVELLKQAGYSYACSTSWGSTMINTDAYQLPRFTPWNTEQAKFLLQMSKNYFRSPKYAQ